MLGDSDLTRQSFTLEHNGALSKHSHNSSKVSAEGSTKCKSCSARIQHSATSDEISAIVCQKCGTLQNKEETIFETQSHINIFSNHERVSESFVLRRFIAKTYAIANTLNLPTAVTDDAIQMAEKVFKDAILKRQRTGPKIAACIYYVARSLDFMIPLKQVSIATQTPMSRISRCLKNCIRRLHLEPLPMIDYIAYLEKYSEYVKNESPQTIVNWSIETESIAKTVANGVSPSVAAAALLKVVLEGRKTPFKFKKLCEDVAINYAYVTNTATKIRKCLFLFCKKIPWKPTTLTAKNVATFLPEIFKFNEKFTDEIQETDTPNTSVFRDKARDMLAMRATGVMLDKSSCNDPVSLMIWELLEKGCSNDEILTENLSTLSKQYLDCTDESSFCDSEIDDDEIESLLKISSKEIETE